MIPAASQNGDCSYLGKLRSKTTFRYIAYMTSLELPRKALLKQSPLSLKTSRITCSNWSDTVQVITDTNGCMLTTQYVVLVPARFAFRSGTSLAVYMRAMR